MNNDLAARGLSSDEARKRLQQYGPNALPEKASQTFWRRFLVQFQSPLIYILLFALVVDITVWFFEGAHGLPIESIAIAFILLLNAGLGVYQESKAETALKHLKELAAPLVWVMRDGQLSHLPSIDLVPADLVRVEQGDRIPIDGTLIETQGVMVDESVLTGESVPVDKEQGGEVFSGTLMVRGKGYIDTSRTGKESAMGKLATMLGEVDVEKTPLERRLEVFGRRVARVILLLAVLIAAGGLFVEGSNRFGHVLLFAVALAVAAIPEGLPAVLTMTLALGVERMAERKAVVRRLSAVEALGSVTVIATDKTGTLTENRMHVRDVDSPDPERALRAMVLANDAEENTEAGDPLELALFNYASAQHIEPAKLKSKYPRHSSLPFDSTYKYMRVSVEEDGQLISYLKGAPEVIIERSRFAADEKQNWMEKAEAYAGEGYRVLALGWGVDEGDDDLTFLGLVLLWDPPRAEVPEAIRLSQEAGIRVVMITGDHPATAVAIAHEVGIPPSRVLTGLDIKTLSSTALISAVKETNIFARVAPEHKLRLVEALKESGEVVAVTGDGVNDAPALKRADVGVAMGQRGSDVSREVADLVLLDDNFATIVAAIEEGRSIYENIQKFIRFLFSTNIAEVLIVVVGAFGAVLMGLRDSTGALFLPLTAVQLLWLNIITDGPPALALALDRNPGVMHERPRTAQSPLLDSASLRFILEVGIAKALVGGVLLIALPRYGYNLETTRTLLFLYMAIAQLVFVYPSRHTNITPKSNLTLHLVVLLSIGLQLLTVLLPSLRRMLGLEALDSLELLVMIVAVLLTWAVAEAFSRATWTFNRQAALR
ncbi:MAG TPA: HAD-IC family P-type ATPase [Pyrinomonadaceae bacterium]|nr:HAD-IC family P-type ATPase [Pyrinomonadaceae bacterium]